MKTNDVLITKLMEDIHVGKIQLPDFQRGWVWDDNRIRALIASITCSFPVGAAMFLDYGNPNIKFKYRAIEGVLTANVPQTLILDGQQRLTSIYASMFCKNPVKTQTDKGKEIQRYYYIDIEKSLDLDCDRIDAIFSVPETKIITSNFGKNIEIDVTSQEKEFENKMFPLNIIFDSQQCTMWQMNYFNFHNCETQIIQEYLKFQTNIISKVAQYQIPIITLEQDTPKEAVCQVFENVNTGGVSLTVFELVTAIFAMDDFPLRDNWEKRHTNDFSGDILKIVTATDFLTACTLLKSYKLQQTVSCKKKDVLNLQLEEYKNCEVNLNQGFIDAEKFLHEERIFSYRDLPYSTQLIPLSVICTLLAEKNILNHSNVREKIRQWYWCGVFGELYGSSNETRYVNDVVGVMDWICNAGKLPKTVEEFSFNPMRLSTLQTRNSAAYKGFMALIMKNSAKDFISGTPMDFVLYKSSNIDIHHIFPQKYCLDKNLNKEKWNSVINKTPLSYSTNRTIGGNAPSKYLAKIQSNNQVSEQNLKNYLLSHWINFDDCENDDFEKFIANRAGCLLNAVEKATGKKILGRDSEEIVKFFGETI